MKNTVHPGILHFEKSTSEVMGFKLLWRKEIHFLNRFAVLEESLFF